MRPLAATLLFALALGLAGRAVAADPPELKSFIRNNGEVGYNGIAALLYATSPRHCDEGSVLGARDHSNRSAPPAGVGRAPERRRLGQRDTPRRLRVRGGGAKPLRSDPLGRAESPAANAGSTRLAQAIDNSSPETALSRL